ncbi:hypothetical protein BpHYR1_050072 [Brachionus plicatilis]|uniref:Uncharacterized protein n=1 Tax=Brachionus plicatilis TaxID=10195 RepID=A0A3M7PP39_BRAPC|nr:hypothetical protein BpHYR1_050072 [Brachionus plicatilis]
MCSSFGTPETIENRRRKFNDIGFDKENPSLFKILTSIWRMSDRHLEELDRRFQVVLNLGIGPLFEPLGTKLLDSNQI